MKAQTAHRLSFTANFKPLHRLRTISASLTLTAAQNQLTEQWSEKNMIMMKSKNDHYSFCKCNNENTCNNDEV
jgi:hypothetical protein